MWKKDEAPPAVPEPTDIPARRSRELEPSARRTQAVPPAQAPRAADQATIGPSITIRGEVSGDEDLLIQGTVEGSVDLGQHSVVVGRDGRVKANISGRVVTVEGEVEGDLKAEEQIVLRPSADVKGDISAPRIVLEDGARFRGMVEMGEARKAASPRSQAVDAGSGRTSPTPSGGGGGEASKDAATAKGANDESGAGADKQGAGTDKPGAGADKAKAAPEKVGGQAR